MKTDPIIPIWIMAILCAGMLCIRRKNIWAYVRQAIAVILIFLINMRIMVPGNNVKMERQTLNVYALFVIDDTISMLANDYDGNTERLTAVKSDCKNIVEELDGAKFAVVTFNNNANLISPFTDNSDYTMDVIDSIYPIDSLYARGSSMNVCYDLVEDTVKRASEKGDGYVAVFFISDGEITNNDKLKSFEGIKKYIDGGAVLGYGTKEGGNMYVSSYLSDQKELLEDQSDYPYKPAVSRIDEGNLKQIAGDMGVTYVNMNSKDNISKITDDIKKGRSSDKDETAVKGYMDIYYIFAAAFALLMLYEFWLVINRTGSVRTPKGKDRI